MKQLLLFSTFIFGTLLSNSGFSQTVYKVDEQRIYSWDNSIPDWQHDNTWQFNYNNGGNKETNLLVLAVPSLEEQFQFKKTYNANNNITLIVSQFWNNGLMEWQDTSQVKYDYDGANNLISETTQVYVSMEWQDSSQIEYEYDGANNQIRETTLYYDPGTMTFVETFSSTQVLYDYLGADVTKQTDQSWITGTGWFTDEIFEVTYASAGMPSQTIDSTWNSSSNMWEIERGTPTYNMGLITKVVFEISDGAGGWDFNGQTLIEYSGTLVTYPSEQLHAFDFMKIVR